MGVTSLCKQGTRWLHPICDFLEEITAHFCLSQSCCSLRPGIRKEVSLMKGSLVFFSSLLLGPWSNTRPPSQPFITRALSGMNQRGYFMQLELGSLSGLFTAVAATLAPRTSSSS